MSLLEKSAPESEQLLLKTLEAEKTRRSTENRIAYFKAYPKQKEFFDAGAQYRERLFIAGNRCGKTHAGAAEMAFHLTGLYPDWWQGKRFDRPVRAWAAGVTNDTVRDVIQEKLVGPPLRRADWGTGMIPKHCIGDVSMARGTPDLIDSISVAHVSGGHSILQFKSYAEQKEKWQGAGLELCWLDEEPDEPLYLEALTRTNETGGLVYLTFTPLAGWSNVVQRFLVGDSKQ
jgi:phage terminase large subunit-like protein